MAYIAADDDCYREIGASKSDIYALAYAHQFMPNPGAPMPMNAAAKYELKNPVTHRAADLNIMSGTLGPDVLDISHLTRDLGIFTFDPEFMSTASTESRITYIDGDAGVLLYHEPVTLFACMSEG